MLHLFAIFTKIGQERAINFLESLWLLLPTLSPGRQIGLDPVSEITVAGNLMDLWARLVPGSDLEFRGGFNSPSVLFDAVAIAGK